MVIDNKREYSLVFPLESNSGKPIPLGRYDKYIVEISKHFGGLTVFTDTLGCSVDKNEDTGEEKLQCEPNILIKTNRMDDKKTAEEDKEFIEEIAEKAGDEFSQWGIMKSEVVCN